MLDEGRDKNVRNYNSTNFRILQRVSGKRKKLEAVGAAKICKAEGEQMNTVQNGKVITVMDYEQWEAEHARRKREKRAEFMEDLKLTLVLTGLLAGGSLAFLLGII